MEQLSAWTRRDLRRQPWLVLLGFTVALLAVYAPALTGGFVWDDDRNVINNPPLRTLAGLGQIWSDVFATQQFYPLTHSSFWAQYQLFGLWSTPYHVVNVLLHACAAFLLWRLLCDLRVPGALLAACLFTFHPVNAESVAWITERKNVLSTSLCLASVIFFVRHAGLRLDGTGPKPTGRRLLWLLSFLLFIFALASKTAVATVPAVLLILVLSREDRRRVKDLLPLVPFFVVGVGAGLLTAWLEQTHVGARGEEFSWTAPERVLIAGRAFWFYLSKLAWPDPLMFIYPRWTVDAQVWWQWLFPAAAVGVLAGSVALGRLVGWGPALALWAYFILIFPALGFFNVWFMRFSYVQDHFVYFASAAFLSLAAAAMVQLLERLKLRRSVCLGFYGVLVTAIAALSWQQAAHFKDYETLFADAIESNPDAWMAQYNLGRHYLISGNPRRAVPYFQQTLRLRPKHLGTHNNLAAALFKIGRQQAGLAHFRRAAELAPTMYDVQGNLATALDDLGKHREARSRYEVAIRLAPQWTRMKRRLSLMLSTTPLAELVDGPRAVNLARQACAATRKTLPRCLDTLSAAYAAAGQFEEAVKTSTRAIRLARQASDHRAARRYARHRAHYVKGHRWIRAR